MTYNPNIPQPTDEPSTSQGQFLTNFQQLNTVFGGDHVEYDDGTVADRGQHKKVTLYAVSADPNQISPKCSLYTKTVNTQTQLFFQNDNAASDVYQVTGGGLAATTWLVYNGASTTIINSLNVASVVRNGALDYTINFTKTYPAGPPVNYCVLVTSNGVFNTYNITKAAGSVRIASTAGGAVDTTDFNVVIFGDYA